MNRFKKWVALSAVAIGMSSLVGNVVNAATVANVGLYQPAGNTVLQSEPGATVNWENPAGADVQAMGIGLPPAGIPAARGVAMARRAAIVDAYRALAETIQGVQVTGETVVQDLVLASDTVKTKVDASIRGAKIVSEGASADGSYYVVMSVPLYGVSSIAAATIPAIPAPHDAKVFVPIPKQEAKTSGETAPKQVVGYTGVIVDAAGMGLKPTFSPAIYDTNGRGIYGTANVSSQQAISKGMVQYSKSAADSTSCSRAGNNPLVIKAVAVKGGASEVNKVHVVVTPEEGDRILAENKISGMLENCAVVFVR